MSKLLLFTAAAALIPTLLFAAPAVTVTGPNGNQQTVTAGSAAVTVTSGNITATNLPTTVDANGGAATASTLRVIPAVNAVLPYASFARPADTTAYAIGDLMANSTTAGSVVPMSWTLARANNGYGHIIWVKVFTSSTSITNAQFRVHFYSKSPTIANGDNVAWSTTSLSSGAPIYLGSADVTVNKQFSDGAEGEGYATVSSAIPFQADTASTTIYGLVEVRSSYTPTSGETVIVTVGGDQQ